MNGQNLVDRCLQHFSPLSPLSWLKSDLVGGSGCWRINSTSTGRRISKSGLHAMQAASATLLTKLGVLPPRTPSGAIGGVPCGCWRRASSVVYAGCDEMVPDPSRVARGRRNLPSSAACKTETSTGPLPSHEKGPGRNPARSRIPPRHLLRNPNPVSRAPYPVSRIPCPVPRIPTAPASSAGS